MEINPKVVKWIRIGIELAFIVVFSILCVAVGVKNKTIKQLKAKTHKFDGFFFILLDLYTFI